MRHLPLGSPADASAGLANASQDNSLQQRYRNRCRILREVGGEFAFSATVKFTLNTLPEVSYNNAGHAPVLLSAQVIRRKSAAAADLVLQVDGTQQSSSVPLTTTAISENNERNYKHRASL